MPMYMDIHEVRGATAEDVAKAHIADVKTQGKYGVEYHKYWFNESTGKIFCLCSAPSPEAAATVHREAHGLVASKIIEVAPEVAEGFLGGTRSQSGGCGARSRRDAHSDRDPGIRTIAVHGHRRLDGAHAAPGRRRGHGSARGPRHDRPRRPGEPRAAARSSTPATASWRASCRRWRRSAAPPGSSARWPSTSRRTASSRSRSGSAPRRESPSRITMDLFGSTVQLAARLCSHAQPEQSLVSNAVAELCIGKGLTFQDLGEVSLKGFDRPIRVHAVQ